MRIHPNHVRKRPLPPAGDRRHRTVGLLGGSFNPAHPGHRFISLEAIKRLGLDEVWWLVTPQNPLKDSRMMLSLAERVRRARLIVRHPLIRVTDIEDRLGTHFTADTLCAMRHRFPCIRFVWLMGADNLLQMPHWDRWEHIFATVPVAVFDRKPYTYQALSSRAAHRFQHWKLTGARLHRLAESAPPAWAFLPGRRHPASATAIREKTGLDKFLKKRKK